MIIKYTTPDHPLSGGNEKKGNIGWTLSFPLDNGDDYLEVMIGEKCRMAFINMLKEENADFPNNNFPDADFTDGMT